VLHWGLRQVGLAGTGSYEGNAGARKLKTATFVLVEALEKVAAQVLTAREKGGQSLTDRIVSREAFAQDLAVLRGASVPEEDLRVLLRFLERDKQALSYNDKTIKFKPPSLARPEPVTSQDTDIASLKALISALASQCTALSQRISSLTDIASSSVKAGNRVAALSALRSKKLAEKSLQQRSDTLHQLEEVFTRIEQAIDQVEIIKVMDASASVMRDLNQKVGGVEAVENVVERLQEEMGKVDEVGKVLEEPLNADAALDEGEIDDELEAMEIEQKKAQEAVEAEKTRKRLEELERFGEKEKATESGSELEEGTKRLSQMSIEDDGRGKSQQEKKDGLIAEET